MSVVDRARDEAFYVWHTYPARTISVLVAAVVFVAAQVGVVLPPLSVAHALAIVIPVLIGGEATHRKVTPA